MNIEDETAAYVPTLEQIAEATAEIRRGWDDNTLRNRMVARQPQAYEVPQFQNGGGLVRRKGEE